MGKILVTVVLPSSNKLRAEITNWDTYGASQALDDELTRFDSSKFAKPTTGLVACSTHKPHCWRVLIPNPTQVNTLKIKEFPTILFYDLSKQKEVGRIEGTPKAQGDVYNYVKGIITPLSKKTSWAWLALGFFLLTPKNKAA